jgi:hypothetical protein
VGVRLQVNFLNAIGACLWWLPSNPCGAEFVKWDIAPLWTQGDSLQTKNPYFVEGWVDDGEKGPGFMENLLSGGRLHPGFFPFLIQMNSETLGYNVGQ